MITRWRNRKRSASLNRRSDAMGGGSEGWDGAGLLTLYERGQHQGARARVALLAGAAVGRDAAGLTLGDLDRAIWALRTDVVGRGGAATARCAACGARLDFALPEGFAPPDAAAMVARVVWGGASHDLRLPRLSDMAAGEFGPERLNPEAPWGEAGFAEAAEAALEAADPGLRVQLRLSCAECGAEGVQDFDPAAYFWAEVEDMARRLVADVARLARHYGWSEAEITAMTPARRALYLTEALR